MLRPINLIFSFLLLCLSHQIVAQTIVIKDSTTNKPIFNVAIFSPDFTFGIISEYDGSAKIENFGNHDTLIIRHSAYETKRVYGALLQELLRENCVTTLHLLPRIYSLNYSISVAAKRIESDLEVSAMYDVIPKRELANSVARTSADILQSTGNISIQKSQGGGGSPILRGFEANKVLLVIDGVRMNNAIYRNGHLQNSITVDNGILERAEVLYGPASVVYGSDALGGVIHYYTKDPQLSQNKDTICSKAGDSVVVVGSQQLSSYVQHSTADNSYKLHFDMNLGFRKWASLTSVTISNFGDIIAGKNRNPDVTNEYGLLFHYPVRLDNRDTMLTNLNSRVQHNTGYSQYDFLQKFLYVKNPKVKFIANLQYSTSTNVSRLDKLNDYNGDYLKYAEYHYGPQNRLLLSGEMHLTKERRWADDISLVAARQSIDEDRVSRKFNSDASNNQLEDINVYSINLDALKQLGENRLYYGSELTFNTLTSTAHYSDINTGEKSFSQTRYPDGDNFTQSYSAYIGFKIKFHEKFITDIGGRYTYSSLHSTFKNSELVLPFDAVDIENGAPTGSLSLIFTPTKSWKFNFIASTGFRIPNIDDYGKIRAKDEQVTVPNDEIKPEYAYNLEAGTTLSLGSHFKVNATAFHTWLIDAIVRKNYSYGGVDSLEYDGDMYRMVANTNASKAFLNGVSLSLNAFTDVRLWFDKGVISYKATFNYQKGRNLTDGVNLGHIPPFFGRFGVAYRSRLMVVEAWMDYAGRKKIEDFSPYNEDNDNEADALGYPEWQTLNFKASYNFGRFVTLQIGVENILDLHYRTFASGVTASERNFIFSIRTRI